jgi:hypothetical protein
MKYELFKGSEGEAAPWSLWVWAPKQAMLWDGVWMPAGSPEPSTPEDGTDPLYGAPLGD